MFLSVALLARQVWGTTAGKVLTAAAAFLVTWAANNYVVRQSERAAIVTKSKQQGTTANAKSSTERADAHRTAGSAARVPCRDCN